MSKSAIFITFVLLIAIGIFGFLTYKVLSPKTQNITDPNKIINQDGTINIPLDVNNPNISSSRLIFYIHGELKDIKKSGTDTEILISPAIKNLPPLVTNPNTLVFSVTGITGKTFTKKTMSDLKIGQKIGFYLFYGVKTHLWRLSRINILAN